MEVKSLKQQKGLGRGASSLTTGEKVWHTWVIQCRVQELWGSEAQSHVIPPHPQLQGEFLFPLVVMSLLPMALVAAALGRGGTANTVVVTILSSLRCSAACLGCPGISGGRMFLSQLD